jgi:hypothetical protein
LIFQRPSKHPGAVEPTASTRTDQLRSPIAGHYAIGRQSPNPIRVHRLKVLAVAIVRLGIAAPLRAQGGPPLETDDPGTPGPGRVELNISVEAERQAHGSLYDAPRLDANVGVGKRFQLKLEVPWRVGTASAQRARSGVGNPIVGVKWRFAESGGVAVSTYPQLTLGGSGRALANGVADAGTALLIPLQIAWDAGPVALNADVGYQRGQGDPEIEYGLALARQLRPTLELLGECHGGGDSDFSRQGVLCGGGFRWDLEAAATLLAAFAAGVAGSVEDRPDHRFYGGMQLRW